MGIERHRRHIRRELGPVLPKRMFRTIECPIYSLFRHDCRFPGFPLKQRALEGLEISHLDELLDVVTDAIAAGVDAAYGIGKVVGEIPHRDRAGRGRLGKVRLR